MKEADDKIATSFHRYKKKMIRVMFTEQLLLSIFRSGIFHSRIHTQDYSISIGNRTSLKFPILFFFLVSFLPFHVSVCVTALLQYLNCEMRFDLLFMCLGVRCVSIFFLFLFRLSFLVPFDVICLEYSTM